LKETINQINKPNGKITKYSKPHPRTSQVSRYGRAHLKGC
jgi:hypothetical protein